MPLILRRPLSDPSFLTNVPHYFFVNGEWGVRYLLVTGTSPHSLVVRETMTLSPNSDCSSNSDNAPHLQLPLNVPSFGPYFSPIPLILRRPWLPLIRFPLLTNAPHLGTSRVGPERHSFLNNAPHFTTLLSALSFLTNAPHFAAGEWCEVKRIPHLR